MTEVSKEAVDALAEGLAEITNVQCYDDDGVFKTPEEAKLLLSLALISFINERGYTIAPVAHPVADEKLREAVKAVEETSRRAIDCGYSWPIIKDALAELAERRAAQAWQPIETAPKDGQRIYAYCSPYGAGTAHYHEGWHLHFCLNKDAHPTHWMPLPTPPATGGAK